MSNYTIEVTENVVNLDVLKDHDVIIEIKSSDNFITFDAPSGYPILFTSGTLPVSRVGSGYLIENLTSGNTIVRTFGDQIISGSKIFSGDIISSGNSSFKFQPTLLTPSYFPVLISDPSTFSRQVYTRTSSQVKSDFGLDNVQNIALSGLNFSAGSGLVGGGNLSSSRSFDIGAGDGISVGTDSISVDSTVVRANNIDQSISGIKSFINTSGTRFTTGGSSSKDIILRPVSGVTSNNSIIISPHSNLISNRTYYLPEAGADADFVMTAGSQIITGSKAFTSSVIFNSGIFNSLRVGATPVALSGHTHTSFAYLNIGSPNITNYLTIQVPSGYDAGVYQDNAFFQIINNDSGDTVFGVDGYGRIIFGTIDAYHVNGLNDAISSQIPTSIVYTSGNQSISGVKTFTNNINVSGLITANSGNFTNSLNVNGTSVSISGHTHTSSNITDFNTSVDSRIINANLQPSGNYALSSHTHTSSNITDFNTSVSGLVNGIYAPLNSPSFSGVPLTPTATAGTNSTQIASTAFVRTEISNLVASAPLALDTLNELATALGNDANFSTTVTNNLAGKANLSGATFTGSISGPSGNFTSLKVNNVDVSANGHTHTASNITDFNTSVDSRITNANLQPSGNYSIVGHTHTSSNITDFNSSVSGLLPVKNIISGTDIAVSNSSGTYTISSTASGVPQIYSTVFNNTGSPIPKMSVVYINGGQGDMPTVALSIADGESTSSKTYAVTTEAISNMSSGRVVVSGPLTALNTDQFNPTAPQGNVNGTTVWLSPTVSGGLTTTKPSAPYHMVAVGTIVRTHQTQGIIEIKIQNGFELHELHNVAINGVTDGQFLQYNSGSGLWLASSSGNFSTLNVNGTGVSISGHTHTSSNITNFNSSVSGLLPVGTANYLSKFGTGGSGLDNSLVFDNGTSVGIGTANPTARFHVIGSGIFSSGIIVGDSSTNSYIYAPINPNTNNIRFNNGGGNRIDFNSSQLFYIGTSYFQGDNYVTRVGETTSTASQKDSYQLVFQNALWDGAASQYAVSMIKSLASTSQNLTSRLAFFTHNGINNTQVERMCVTSSGGYIGIGTATPASTLHVIGSGLISDNLRIGGLKAYRWDGNAWGYDRIVFREDVNNKITSDSNGNYNWLVAGRNWTLSDVANVGIGTISPSTRLEVLASGTTSIDIAHFSNSNGVEKAKVSLSSAGDGTFSIIDASNNTDIFLTSNASTASYINAGNVGIGTTVPQELLHVSGTISSSAGNLLRLNNSSATTNPSINFRIGGVGNYDSHFFISRNGTDVFGIDTNNRGVFLNSFSLFGNQQFLSYNNANAFIKLQNTTTNDLEISAVSGILFQSQQSTKMRMDQSGNFGIGTTTPSSQLHVIGTGIFSSGIGIGINTPLDLIHVSGSSANAQGIRLENADGYGGSIQADNGALYFKSSTATAFRVQAAKIRLGDGATSTAIELTSNGSISQDGNGGGLTFSGTTAKFSNGINVTNSGTFTSVGIGTITPSSVLDVIGESRIQGTLYFNQNSTDYNDSSRNRCSIQRAGAQNLTITGGSNTIQLAGDGGKLILLSSSTGMEIGSSFSNAYVMFNPGGSEKARITPSGFLGIGTTTPSTQLHVIGSGTFSNSVSIGSSTLSDSNLPSIINSTNLYLWSNFN